MSKQLVKGKLKYAEIKKIYEDTGCVFKTKPPANPNSNFTDRSVIEWICGECNEEQETQARSFRGYCRDCGIKNHRTQPNKPGRNTSYTYEQIQKIFQDSDGCILLTKKPTTQENAIGDRTKIEWICGMCEIKTTSSFVYFKNKTIKQCQTCTSSAGACGRHGKPFINLRVFKTLLGTEGWQFKDDPKKYRNTKSVVDVICNNGHHTSTSYNRFQQGHRCKECIDNQKKHDEETIRAKFAEYGLELLDSYKNRNTPMRYRCTCGDNSSTSYRGFLNSINKCCYNCSIQLKRVEYEKILQKLNDQGCTLVTPEEDYVNQYQLLYYICQCDRVAYTPWKQIQRGGLCGECAQTRREQTCEEKYGTSNPFASPEIQEQIKATNMERYGVEHNMQVQATKDKVKATCQQRYGVTCILATPEVQEKAIQAHIEKYGDRPGRVESIREKMRDACRAIFGVDYPLQSKEIHMKIKTNNLEKYGNEVYLASDTGKAHMMDKYGNHCYVHSDTGKAHMMDKYGHEVYLCSEAGMAHMTKKYGFPHAMQSPELFRKMVASSYRLKLYTFPSGRIEKIQGYEGFCIDYLMDSGIDENDIVCDNREFSNIDYVYDGKLRVYHPDMYVKSHELIIEVKSTYTALLDKEKNIAKWRAAFKNHHFVVYIFSPKGEKLYEINDMININMVLEQLS